MFVNNLKICVLILLEILVTNGQFDVDITFKNVTVEVASIRDTHLSINISQASSLKENPIFNEARFIDDIKGDLPVLHEDSVTDLLQLEAFGIYEGNLNEIKPGAFKNLRKLEYITIQKCQLTTIENGTFTGLGITHLLLDYNNISTISLNAFENMTNLKVINLGFNSLSSWNELWFLNVPSLNFLVLSHNGLEELPDKAFENVLSTKDVTVEFANNKIVSVGQKLFKKSTTIKSLDLSNNQIKTFGDKILYGVAGIEKLDLSGNQITCFSGNWDKMLFARMSNLTGNPLKCAKRIGRWQEAHCMRIIKE